MSDASGRHLPVLCAEAMASLDVRPGAVIVDATFGGGGYTRAALEAGVGEVIALDRDPAAIARGQGLVAAYPGRLRLVEAAFSDLEGVLAGVGRAKVDGVVLDIGVSSFQIDQAERGFSFQADGPLDMRMSLSGPSAADVVAEASETLLADVLFHLGEEPDARRIARALVQARRLAPITTTGRLAEVVSDAVGGRKGARTHPATRTFQALRLWINDELGELARVLAAAERVLAPGGRLVVVSFHSLEDRIVKQFLRDRARDGAEGSRHMPAAPSTGPAASFTLLHRGGLAATEAEVTANPRARSARLRAGVRTEAPAWGVAVPTGVPDLPAPPGGRP
jgi:16S rRNA (cytosine1402-N4)-methyltransferase